MIGIQRSRPVNQIASLYLELPIGLLLHDKGWSCTDEPYKSGMLCLLHPFLPCPLPWAIRGVVGRTAVPVAVRLRAERAGAFLDPAAESDSTGKLYRLGSTNGPKAREGCSVTASDVCTTREPKTEG